MNTNHKRKLQSIGKKIAYFRKQKGLTQEELAIKASISYSYLTKIEAPNYNISFSIDTFLDIASALGIEPRELL